jgi:SpoVK/Ycf46/Vps4 family AAA+-type ATPase
MLVRIQQDSVVLVLRCVIPMISSSATRLCVCLLPQVIDASGGVQWQDIAGLETVKHLIKEIVVWPMLNPHLFTVSGALWLGSV